MIFTWNGGPFSAFVNNAVKQALHSGADFGHQYWQMTAPVSDDPRTSGDLRRSWYDQVIQFGSDMKLVFGDATRYAIYVELGTTKMSPRAPVRGTAGEIVAILPSYFRNELNH